MIVGDNAHTITNNSAVKPSNHNASLSFMGLSYDEKSLRYDLVCLSHMMKIFISSESGSRDEAEEKVKRNLEEALEEHDQRIINIFDVEIVPLLQWNEELLVMKAFLTNDFYMKGTFTDELKQIYIKRKEEISNAN